VSCSKVEKVEKIQINIKYLYTEFFILQDLLVVQKKHLSLLHKQMMDVIANYNISKSIVDKKVKEIRQELRDNDKYFSGYSNTNIILSNIKTQSRSTRLPKVGVPPKEKIAFKILHKSNSHRNNKSISVSSEITRWYSEPGVAQYRLVDIMRASNVKVTDHLIPTLNSYIEIVNDLNARYTAIYDNYIQTEYDYKRFADYLVKEDVETDAVIKDSEKDNGS
jgi:hypothetical protein